jgi:hypothetical protein
VDRNWLGLAWLNQLYIMITPTNLKFSAILTHNSCFPLIWHECLGGLGKLKKIQIQQNGDLVTNDLKNPEESKNPIQQLSKNVNW